jgi:hypothetical protein
MYIFLDNKYTKWYFSIIGKASLRNNNLDYVENHHHIVPKCLGGDDMSTNIISLTLKEHVICHLLLTKMTTGLDKAKMYWALRAFTMMQMAVGREDQFK